MEGDGRGKGMKEEGRGGKGSQRGGRASPLCERNAVRWLGRRGGKGCEGRGVGKSMKRKGGRKGSQRGGHPPHK